MPHMIRRLITRALLVKDVELQNFEDSEMGLQVEHSLAHRELIAVA